CRLVPARAHALLGRPFRPDRFLVRSLAAVAIRRPVFLLPRQPPQPGRHYIAVLWLTGTLADRPRSCPYRLDLRGCPLVRWSRFWQPGRCLVERGRCGSRALEREGSAIRATGTCLCTDAGWPVAARIVLSALMGHRPLHRFVCRRRRPSWIWQEHQLRRQDEPTCLWLLKGRSCGPACRFPR